MTEQWSVVDGDLVAAALVPGLPHLVDTGVSAAADRLAAAMGELGDSLAARGVEKVVYYSTQWMSVLGHMFQGRAELVGTHVDENWHDFPDLPFHFKVDQALARRLAHGCEEAGYQTKVVDYEDFPVDTGTIVADLLINRGRFQSAMVSCCVYSDYADTLKLAGVMRRTLAQAGAPTAMVCVSSLSTDWFLTNIDRTKDRISSDLADAWNRRLLALVETDGVQRAASLLAEYKKVCRTDMGMKALAVLEGVGAGSRPGRVRAYGPIYGTGAAVIEF